MKERPLVSRFDAIQLNLDDYREDDTLTLSQTARCFFVVSKLLQKILSLSKCYLAREVFVDYNFSCNILKSLLFYRVFGPVIVT